MICVAGSLRDWRMCRYCKLSSGSRLGAVNVGNWSRISITGNKQKDDKAFQLADRFHAFPCIRARGDCHRCCVVGMASGHCFCWYASERCLQRSLQQEDPMMARELVPQLGSLNLLMVPLLQCVVQLAPLLSLWLWWKVPWTKYQAKTALAEQ
jgi:hypothetical protein